MFSSLQVGWPPVWGCFHAQARRRVVLPDSDIDGVLDDEPHALQEATARPRSVLLGVEHLHHVPALQRGDAHIAMLAPDALKDAPIGWLCVRR